MGNFARDEQITLVLDLDKALGKVSLPDVWARATPFNFTTKILRVLCGYFKHQRRVQFVRCGAASNRGQSPWFEVELPPSLRGKAR